MSTPLLSIIIVTLNRKKEIINCLNTIFDQNFKKFEIIVIDNNSSDNTAIEIKKKFPSVNLYKTHKNLGTSYTRNAAISFSKGEIILFLDSDVYLNDKNVLFELINKLDDERHVLGGETVLDENNNIVGKKKLTLYSNGMIIGNIIQNNRFLKTDCLATCILLTKKKYLQKIGGFDHFYFFYLEDLDLTYRMKKKGYNLYLFDKCNIVHYFSPKSRFRNFFKSAQNRVYFVVKNFTLLKIFLLPINDIIYLYKKFLNKIFYNTSKNFFIFKSKKENYSVVQILFLFRLGIITIFSLLYSYIFIPFYLFNLRKIREERNFIDLIDKKDFIKL